MNLATSRRRASSARVDDVAKTLFHHGEGIHLRQANMVKGGGVIDHLRTAALESIAKTALIGTQFFSGSGNDKIKGLSA